MIKIGLFSGVAVLLAGTAWAGVNGVPARPRGANWVDAGDGYRCRGEWVALGRVADEWAVPAGDAARLQARGTVEPLPQDEGPGHGPLRLVRPGGAPAAQRLNARTARDRWPRCARRPTARAQPRVRRPPQRLRLCRGRSPRASRRAAPGTCRSRAAAAACPAR